MTQVARSILASFITLALWPVAAGAQAAPPSPPPAPAAAAPASAAPEATPTPVAQDPAVDKRAKAEFLAWQTGTLDRSKYSQRLSDAATADVIGQVSPQLKALGALKSVEFTAGWILRGDKAYQYLVTCANGSMLMLYVLDPAGKVDGVRYKPATPTQ